MLELMLAHAGRPVAPHDLLTAWSLDPFVVLPLALVVWLYLRGRRHTAVWRNRAFLAAIVALVAAVVSPLDALSGALASAHMVQHVLLVVVAAPLLAVSAPGSVLLRGAPPSLRRAPRRLRDRLGVDASSVRLPSRPAPVLLLYVAVLWGWHSSAAYDAAVAFPAVHAVEHLMLLGTGVLLWRVVVGRRTSPSSYGLSILLVFATAMQGVFLALLLTFANEPWYASYVATTTAWGLTPLSDQRLAGAIMWVPTGVVHVTVAMFLLGAWLRSSDDTGPGRAMQPGRVGA